MGRPSCFLVLLATSACVLGTRYVKQPYGPKMCELFCRQVVDCTGFIVTTPDLSCHLTTQTVPTETSGVTVQKFHLRQTATMLDSPCRAHFTIVHSRTRGLQCVMSGGSGQIRIPEFVSRIVYTSFLMPYLYQMDLNNQSSIKYAKYKIEHIVDIAFVNALKELIVATKQPSVLSCRSGEVRPRAISNVSATLLVVDQIKSLLFMRVRRNLMIMTPEGKVLNTFKVSIRFMTFAVHRTLETVYCAASRQLIAYDYKGRMVGVLINDVFPSFVTLDAKGETLYYGKNNIYGYSLVTTTTRELMGVHYTVKRFQLYGNGEAVVTFKKQNIFTVDLEHATIKKLITISNERRFNALVCLVP